MATESLNGALLDQPPPPSGVYGQGIARPPGGE